MRHDPPGAAGWAQKVVISEEKRPLSDPGPGPDASAASPECCERCRVTSRAAATHEPEPRPYQADLVTRIRARYAASQRRVLAVAPTGSGKTVLFAYMTSRAAARDRRVLVLVHRVELVEQVAEALGSFEVEHGIIAAGFHEAEAPVQIASVQTLGRRLERHAGAFDLIVVDECHHAVASTLGRVLAAFPQAKILGVTATPERLDDRGLRDALDELVPGPTTAELIEAGFLAPATVYAPALPTDLSEVRIVRGDYDPRALAKAMSDGGIVGNAVDHYRRLAGGVPALAFCVGISHSLEVAAAFRAAGFRAAHVDGDTPRAERREMIAALGAGGLDVLCNCRLISEGVDVPVLGAAILLRPTRSVALHLQMIGRALRPSPGKARAIVLDHAGNVWRHGLLTDERAWSLDARRRRVRGEPQTAPVRRCRECGALVPAAARRCPECGEPLAVREMCDISGQLVEAKHAPLLARLRNMSYPALVAEADSREKLELAAVAREYKRGWVWHQLRDREGAP